MTCQLKVRSKIVTALGSGLLFLVAGCGSDEKSTDKHAACDFGAQTGCSDGQVCEKVEGGAEETGCFAPVTVEGRVVRADDPNQGIEGARVVGRDENGAVVSLRIAVSGADGAYSLRVPTPRKEDGTPAVPALLLRADASGFATFPSGLRVAIPVDVSQPEKSEAGYRVVNDTTTVALDELADASGLGSVSGKVLAEGAAGTLVVAGGASGVADKDGTYVIFNVPAGELEVRGYAAGLSLEPASALVKAGSEVDGVDLAVSDAALGAVNGSVSFVNASAKTTSVVLVVASTFNEALKRGEVPRGLRAFPVSGAYAFADVPAGDYVVLAAFENDELVRDPDESIGGTAIQRVSVSGSAMDVAGFKITGALAVVAPGKDAPELLDGVPRFEWADDSSEDGYEVTVLDTFGTEVWKNVDVPRVSGASSVTLDYAGPELSSGYYQFRAVSWREEKKGAASRTYISATEDLKGVFIVP
ncbi:MAG TPA: hypothetical protein VHP33_38195 [Polyangiaceae bacterium]|nr:hypothetical protein [Polyangiaceae bacterium]